VPPVRSGLYPPGHASAGETTGGQRAIERQDATGSASVQQAPVQAKFEIVSRLATALAGLRQGGEAAVHIRSVGLRQATIVIGSGPGRQSVWSVPAMEVRLDHHRRRSFISGEGRVAAGGEPWGVEFRLEDSEKAQSLRLSSRVSDLVPSSLAGNAAFLSMLGAIDVPVTARAEAELSNGGEVLAARFDVDLGQGRVRLAPLGGLPLSVDNGRLSLVWEAASGRLQLAPSPIQLEGSFVKLAGSLVPVTRGVERGLEVDLWTSEGAIANDRRGPNIPVERLALKSRVWPDSGLTELIGFAFKAGGADVTASGAMGGSAGAARLEGRIGPMSAAELKAIWPVALQPELRATVAASLVDGEIKGGRFTVGATGGADAPTAANATPPGQSRVMLTLEGSDLVVQPATGLPPVTMPRALLRIDGTALEVDVPEAAIKVAANRQIALRASRIAVAALDATPPVAEIDVKANGPLAAVLELARREPLALLKSMQVPAGADGKVEAHVKAFVPLAERLQPSEIRLEGKLRLVDGRVPDVFGPHDITGATMTLGATEKAIDIKGELLLAGVLAKLGGQWIIGEPAERQPPLTITTRLDTADRRQLGLDLDDLVQGEVPLEVQVAMGAGDAPKVQVSADLSSAELTIDGLSWRKPAGRAARLGFDVAKARQGKGFELQAFKVSGDGVAIDGTVEIGPDNKAQSYRFPGFSLNVVTNLEVEGVKRKDRIWQVKARGKTFDATELIRTHYSVSGERRVKKRTNVKGIDLEAHIDTVLGLNDTSLKQVVLSFQERDDEMAGVSLQGQLEGGGRLVASMPMRPGAPRVIVADTDNAGQALKMIGLYTSMVGGRGQLQLNLDAAGGADRAGQIAIRKFRVLGDPIVSEVLQGADDSRPAIAAGSQRGARRVVREEIAFDEMRSVFSTGNGQLALESLGANGPLVGVSLRGKADFRTRRLSLGGTFVPLSGLNRALSGIPLIRELLTGPKGEGVFGITFGVNGSMASPEVIVNPFSIVAPGVLREIFQMAPEDARVTPAGGARATGSASGGARVRASPPLAGDGSSLPQGPIGGDPRVLDGWSSKALKGQ
jgi:hypothetical protein